jgi:hypothetical protein
VAVALVVLIILQIFTYLLQLTQSLLAQVVLAVLLVLMEQEVVILLLVL